MMAPRTRNTGRTGRPGLMPRSPAEALEPTRAPSRPRGTRTRAEARRLGPALRVINGLLTFTFLTLAVATAGTFWLSAEFDKPGPLREQKMVQVRKGEGVRDIAHRLEQDGVIASQHVFIIHYIASQLSGWFGSKPLQLKAGEYELQPGISMRQIAELLGEGKVQLLRLTMPEGLTSHQIVERLKAEANLAGDIDTVPLEGSMLPETYRMSRGATRQSVIDLMQAEHRKVLENAWAARQPDLPLQSMDEAVILASIVERETGRNDKHADIASVFINRLRKGMPLQSDPTILYGMFGGQVSWGRPINRNEIAQKTTHNTYQMRGLPPTPIANPSRVAIQAVLNPTKSNYLYFVASGNGASVFSQTLEEHNAAVANWRKVEKDIRAKQSEAAKGQAAADAPASGASAPAGSAGGAPAAAPQSAPQETSANPVAVSDVPLPVRKPKR